jgi:excisionase family DNA binding protein
LIGCDACDEWVVLDLSDHELLCRDSNRNREYDLVLEVSQHLNKPSGTAIPVVPSLSFSRRPMSKSREKEPIEARRYGWPRLMWIPTAAEYLGARPGFVEESVRSGDVRVIAVGNRKVIPREELDRWVQQQITNLQ